MPFLAPFLKTTFLLSSVGLAASYALYENNEGFRNFVDNAVDRILAAWDHVLASLSPEERERQRDAQRREVLVALSSGGDASGARSVFSEATGNEVVGADARLRRRNLWEVAERNAANIRAGLEDAVAGMQGKPTLFSTMQTPRQEVGSAESGGAPDPPEVVPEDTEMAARSAPRTVAIPIQSSPGQSASRIPVNVSNQSPPVDDDNVSVSGTSTASGMSAYSNINTPTSSMAGDPFMSAAESRSRSNSRTASIRSASTETMSHFTQSAPPSVVDEDDAYSEVDGSSIDGDGWSVSDVDLEREDPSSAAVWQSHRQQAQ